MSSVTFRLSLGFCIVVTATTALILTVGGFLLSRQMVRGIELLNEAEFVEVRERLDRAPQLTPAEISEQIGHHMVIDAALYYCQIHTPSGTVLYRSQNLGNTILPILPSSAPENWTANVPTLGMLHISEYFYRDVHVQIASPLGPTQRLLRQYIQVCGFLLGGTAVLGLALGVAFARFAMRPVREVIAAARRISADNLSARLPLLSTKDEIGRLTVLLNEIFDRLERSFQQVRRFTADASHELKTPLAVIRLNAERARPHVSADSAAATALEDLLVEIDRLQRVIDTLLFFSKAETGAVPLNRQPTSTRAFIDSFNEDALVLAEDAGVSFQLSRNDDATVPFEADLLRQLLFNLVSNALHVSKNGDTLTLSSTVEEDRWVVRLTDEGPGLPDEQLERIFERFVRYEQQGAAHSRGGHGLGLAICRSIAHLHGGRIAAENRKDRSGLVATLELPAR